jgi:hypothetical protein
MNAESPQPLQYLLELYRLTDGDLSAKASMFEVGAAIGLEKNEAGKMAEELIALGWVEIKTLAGGIGITAEGAEQAREKVGAGSPADTDLSLGDGPVLAQQGREALETVLTELKTRLPALNLNYDRLEEILIDIKTLEVQLLSPRPKTQILRQVLSSLQAGLDSAEAADLTARVERLAHSH